MKELLAELYNKVMSFFQSEKGENTKDIASNRLKLVLMHDRTKLDPLTLDKLRMELIDVISKYIVIDKEMLELNLAGEGDSIALMLNIPVVRTKSEKEILEESEEDNSEEIDTESDEETVEEIEEDEAAQTEEIDETENVTEFTDELESEIDNISEEVKTENIEISADSSDEEELTIEVASSEEEPEASLSEKNDKKSKKY